LIAIHACSREAAWPPTSLQDCCCCTYCVVRAEHTLYIQPSRIALFPCVARESCRRGDWSSQCRYPPCRACRHLYIVAASHGGNTTSDRPQLGDSKKHLCVRHRLQRVRHPNTDLEVDTIQSIRAPVPGSIYPTALAQAPYSPECTPQVPYMAPLHDLCLPRPWSGATANSLFLLLCRTTQRDHDGCGREQTSTNSRLAP
jgi:hypothetical protein